MSTTITIDGRRVEVKLCDTDDARLLVRLQAILAQYPAAPASATPQTPPVPVDTTPQCPTHGAMKPSTKGQGWYCPHKLADGSWCKAK